MTDEQRERLEKIKLEDVHLNDIRLPKAMESHQIYRQTF